MPGRLRTARAQKGRAPLPRTPGTHPPPGRTPGPGRSHVPDRPGIHPDHRPGRSPGARRRARVEGCRTQPSDRRGDPQPPGLSTPSGAEGPTRKKVPETDAIFGHIRAARSRAAAESDTLRTSIDTKAKVKIGDSCRGGRARGATAVKAVDHDTAPEAVLVPFGVLEIHRGAVPIHQPLFFLGRSKQTSDFIADGLESWWGERKPHHPGVGRIHIELDNGRKSPVAGRSS
ncbi:MAG: hypothetical protein J0I06_17760 [Planctomycetes bacterium]|nr:hypothetical protein [Planctomycetota bacterium]